MSTREIIHLPELSHGDEFAARLTEEDGRRCILFAVLVAARRRRFIHEAE